MLRRGNDRLLVWHREAREGATGRTVYVDVGEPVEIYGRLQPATDNDIQVVGLAGESGEAVLTLRRLSCPSFPGDDLARVVDADGREYEVVGEPTRHRESKGTRRDTVLLRQKGLKRGITTWSK